MSSKEANNHVAIAQVGDKVSLTSWTREKKTRYFISITDVAFEVSETSSSKPMDISDKFFEKKNHTLRWRAPSRLSIHARDVLEFYILEQLRTSCLPWANYNLP